MDQQTALNVGLLVLGLGVLLAVVASALSIYRSLRDPGRHPPLSEELYRDFATKSDLAQLRNEYLKTVGEAFDAIRRLQAAVEVELRNQTAALSRIEGKLENCPGADVCAQLRALMSHMKR